MKVETKPSIWHITLTCGAYSDRAENHYFVSANGRDEAKVIFKEWFKGNARDDDYKYGIIFEDGEQWQYKDTPDFMGESGISWDAGYGNAWDCTMQMLEVIYP